ncbi:putative transmembrane protein ZNF593OS [Trachinotus anak]|uniref:putative transmembrane protein ZNF593OS n=1 Tax=Trachinotus anak TaxID=443729 RepID=UPI0039F1A3F1
MLPASYKDYSQNTARYSSRRRPSVPRPAPEPARPQILRATPALPVNPFYTTSAGMIIRLGRLTPGYFRLLQRQVAGEVQTQPQDRAVNQIAMMLAIMGLSLSYYSAKQMTEKVQVQPAP